MLSYKLEKFEGPLDLLLHLIEKNKVSIYDIPIFEITNQYMSGEPKYSGVQTTSTLEGEVAMKVDIDITNKTPTINAKFIRNTTGGRVMPELGSAKTARETL